MSVSIKVAIRCRPWTCDDMLGVIMQQSGDEEGTIELINSKYSTTNFGFNWSWWSAHNTKAHLVDDADHKGSNGFSMMKYVSQEEVYASCGQKIKKEVLEGNAVVMFAYGLSGSGKTFTVFGKDATYDPGSWFNFAERDKMWGIFPNLGFDLFDERKDGWKVTMKYFQNVVDIVRDLMSSTGEERMYKEGMRKDQDGFMDVQWCGAKVLADWNDLRNTFTEANARKAIAPTQFNPRSTRGHCIMTLEVETPHPDMEGVKQRGRVYVCDLAGTEPAGEIVHAIYKMVKQRDGTEEEVFQGPHPDPKKSKELQDQGKKINLSLSEMAQFFMKMAQAVKKKTLKPGKGIPGCNSYFLCKYLKDTMLQARTYLFCGVRPEAKYLNYTFSTLNFAKNASVIKLSPKKATGAASPMERKLMAELEEMKKLVAELKAAGGGGGGGDGGGGGEAMKALQDQLAAKQEALAAALAGDTNAAEEERLNEQKEEYATHGIDMVHFSKDTELPYMINIDEDPFREKRFMYVFREATTKIASNGDIKPFSFRILPDHCHVDKTEDGACTMTADSGEVFVNGEKLASGAGKALSHLDRVVVGDEMMLFVVPGTETEATEMSAEDAITEYREGMMKAAAAGGGGAPAGGANSAEMEALRKQVADLQAGKGGGQGTGATADKNAPSQSSAAQEAREAAMKVVQSEMLELIPKIQDVQKILELFNRSMLKLEAGLQMTPDKAAIPKVKINVKNEQTNETISLDVFEFSDAHGALKTEVMKLQTALNSGKEYTIVDSHDPIDLLFDKSFLLGTSFSIMEYLIYFFPTDEEEQRVHIKQAVAPFGNAGFVEMVWTPLGGPEEEDWNKEPADIVDPSELVGKPWTYELAIKSCIDLPITTDACYCQYEFNGEEFTTLTVEQDTNRPQFEYKAVHHVEVVTEEFVEYLKNETLRIDVYVNPYISNPPKDKISTTNAIVAHNLGHGKDPFEEYKDQIADQQKTIDDMQSKIETLAQQLKDAGIEPKACLCETGKRGKGERERERERERESKEQTGFSLCRHDRHH